MSLETNLGRIVSAAATDIVARGALPPTPSPVGELLAQETILPLDQFFPSPTQPRTNFNQAELLQLAESIKVRGVLQAILARRVEGHKPPFEIVFGERRWRASKLAGLTTIPVKVRQLTDVEVAEVQMIENLQREDLHELEEAEGYRRLMKDHAYTAPMIAKQIGKSKEYVTARVKLTALCKAAREVFLKGTIKFSVALLIARIPVEKLQLQALKEILEESEESFGKDREPMPYREAAEWVRDNYMLELSKAPFDRNAIYFREPNALRALDKCAGCPKRTGNQPELFSDVKGADICTDPECYGIKRDAHFTRVREEAKRDGKKVIAGAEAKKLVPHGNSTPTGFVKLDTVCYDAKKGSPTWGKMLGKDAPETVLFEHPESKELIEVIDKSAALRVAKQKGLVAASYGASSGSDYKDSQKASEKRARLETAMRIAVLKAIVEKPPLDFTALRCIADDYFRCVGHDAQKRICNVYGWEVPGYGKKIEEIDGFSGAQLGGLILALSLVGDVYVNSYNNSKPTDLHAAAARAGVDFERIRSEMQGAATRPAPWA